jgi:hypothetical protein
MRQNVARSFQGIKEAFAEIAASEFSLHEGAYILKPHWDSL